MLSLARYYRNGPAWELVSLTETEIREAQEVVRKKNNELFEECLADALGLIHKYRPWHNNVAAATPIAQQLFERKAIHINFVLDAILKRKIHELKKGGGNA
jgi:predicted dinucleotide-utilizing enzyme